MISKGDPKMCGMSRFRCILFCALAASIVFSSIVVFVGESVGNVDALIARLKSGDAHIRRKAAEALGGLGDPKAVDPSIEALNDTVGNNRREAIIALGRIGKKEAAEAVLPFLEDGRVTGAAAALSLEQMGWKPTDDRQGTLYFYAKEQWRDALEAAPEVNSIRDNSVRGPVQIRMPILLPFDVCDCGEEERKPERTSRPSLIGYPRLEFRRSEQGATAELYLQYLSYPRTTWVVDLVLLDKQGRTLITVESTIANSGKILGVAGQEEGSMLFDLGKSDVLSQAKEFLCNIESLRTEQGNLFLFGEEAPLQLNLDAAEYSNVLGAEWLRIEKVEGEVFATVHVKTLSWPKRSRRLRLDLFGDDEQLVGGGETEFENSGVIFGLPVREEKDLRFEVLGVRKDPEAAKRYWFSMERIGFGRENKERPGTAAE